MKRQAAFLMMLVFLVGCERSSQSGLQPGGDEIPDQEGWHSQVVVTQKGQRTAVIRYGHMQKFSKKDMVLFNDGIEVDFYNPDGEHTSNLVAEEGRMWERIGKVEAFKNVVVTTDSGMVLKTQYLVWEQQEEKIYTDKMVTITTKDGDVLTGQGFESDQNFEKWVILKPKGVSKKRVDLSEFELEPSKQTVPSDSVTARQEAVADSVDRL